ncbi:hypothetical protein [Solibacillus sp. NPDC093137]|uniref:hypothetical protein n=1 Tax=Solibacillus sp. NPDC093137 TaxID=3390678 RepID=UPI003CFE60B2
MTNEKEEQAFLEAQLQWVKQRDDLLAQVEEKLYEMKHIAEQVALDDTSMLENQKLRLNERFLQLKNEVAELENQLRIFYN